MGATFYVEPLLTFDLDVFVVLPHTESGLITLSPLYDALKRRGYQEDGECVLIEGVPVQFLPAYNELLEEALNRAVEIFYEQTRVRVLRAEHLIAICVQTGRDKDRQRVHTFLEQATIDLASLSDILQRHRLEAKFETWKA